MADKKVLQDIEMKLKEMANLPEFRRSKRALQEQARKMLAEAGYGLDKKPRRG